MGRLIEVVGDETPLVGTNKANMLSRGPKSYWHRNIIGTNDADGVKDELYLRTPRSSGRDNGIMPDVSGSELQYKSLFTRAEMAQERCDEINGDEQSSEDDDLSDADDDDDDDDDYGDSTMSSREEETFSESWSSILVGSDAPKSVSLLHHIPRKSVSDSTISPVNIPFDGSLKPETLATDSLMSSLNKAVSVPELRKQAGRGESRLSVSNFARAFNVLKTSIHRTSYSMLRHSGHLSPWVTDETVPGFSSCHECSEQVDSDDEDSDLEELETHECASADYLHRVLELPRGTQYRGRDSRMNSTFLRLYAIDYDARCSEILPNSYTSRELTYVINKSRMSKDFHRRYNIIRISNLSRDKLWDSVVLPPRRDTSPSAHIDPSNYVYVGSDDEKYDPRIRFEDSGIRRLYYPKPAGVSDNGRSFRNSESPQAGNTRLQYTIKGWCNARWLDSSRNF